jgi:hypothetical protein
MTLKIICYQVPSRGVGSFNESLILAIKSGVKESVQLMTFEPSIHPQAKASRHRWGNLHRSSLLKIVAIRNRSLRLHDLVLMRAMIHTRASNLGKPPIPLRSRIGRVADMWFPCRTGLSRSVDPICHRQWRIVSSGPYPRRETKRRCRTPQSCILGHATPRP